MRIISREFLPTTTPSVHAATMAFFKGHPVYAWFAGSREGAADVAIHLYNLNNDKKIIIIGGNDGIPRWNPVLMPIKDKLFLFTKAGLFCDRWTTYIHNITTWPNDITNKEIVNTANMLPAGLNGPVKTRPIIKANTIWCGSSTETIYDWTSWIEQYRYDGKSFSYENRSNPLFLKDKKIYQDFNGVTRSSLGVIQPTLWIDKNDKMKCLMRSSRNLGKIYYSKRSELDSPYENVWDLPTPTNLPNPNSGIDTIYINEKLYVMYNPSDINRFPLVISQVDQVEDTSEFIVKDTLIIKDQVNENNPCFSKELSYPYCCTGKEGKIHLVYTYARKKIEEVVIET